MSRKLGAIHTDDNGWTASFTLTGNKLELNTVTAPAADVEDDGTESETWTARDTTGDEDTGPEYDTVSQNDIRVGDIVEYHNGGLVRRWEVLDVEELLIPGFGPERAHLRLMGEHNDTETVVDFPIHSDPFILRPRSS